MQEYINLEKGYTMDVPLILFSTTFNLLFEIKKYSFIIVKTQQEQYIFKEFWKFLHLSAI